MKRALFMILLSMGLAPSVRSQSPHVLIVKDTGKIVLADPVSQTYMIRTKHNKVYLPAVLSKDFMQNGLKVTFEGNVDTARLKRARLAGIPINIDKIKKQ